MQISNSSWIYHPGPMSSTRDEQRACDSVCVDVTHTHSMCLLYCYICFFIFMCHCCKKKKVKPFTCWFAGRWLTALNITRRIWRWFFVVRHLHAYCFVLCFFFFWFFRLISFLFCDFIRKFWRKKNSHTVTHCCLTVDYTRIVCECVCVCLCVQPVCWQHKSNRW